MDARRATAAAVADFGRSSAQRDSIEASADGWLTLKRLGGRGHNQCRSAGDRLSMNNVTLEDVKQAAERIAAIAHRTPVMTSRTFNEMTGGEAYFKCENFQRGGAFKIRGAANMIFALGQEKVRNGVVAYSSGNHAQAVAIAAGFLGVPATIVMPHDAPRSKVAATQGYGARVVVYDRLREDRVA